MMPPMRQKVSLLLPVIGDDGKAVKDVYGKPKTQKVESKARVQRTSKVIQDAQGTEHRIALEIDLPPEVNPKSGVSIEFTEISGEVLTGVIRSKEESVNLSGSKVYFRTVLVDG